MKSSESLETTSHVVAHLIREIESALRDVLEVVVEKTDDINPPTSITSYVGRVRTVIRALDDSARTVLGAIFNRPPEASQVEGVDHRDQIEAVLEGLRIPLTDPVAIAWLSLPSLGLSKQAHRDALDSPRAVDKDFRRMWEDFQAILDFILEQAATRFVASLEVLDEILKKPVPSSADLKTLRTKVPNNAVTFTYFFDHLDSPKWIEPLRKKGFFTRGIPPAIRDDNGIAFPPWPQGRFLTRMATQSQGAAKEVTAILAVLPRTDNVRVHQSVIETALALPPKLATKLCAQLDSWIKDGAFLLVTRPLGQLISHLAQGGQVQTALSVAGSTLQIRASKNGDTILSQGSVGIIDNYEYEQILTNNVPHLIDAAGLRGVNLLIDLLEAALAAEGKHKQEDDYSYIWRASIETPHEHAHSIKDMLVTALVKACTDQVAKDTTSLRPVVESLENRTPLIFRRIVLHLLRAAPEDMRDEVSTCLMDHELFVGISARHEYLLLLRDRFEKLSDADRDIVLGWIETGPDETRYRERFMQMQGRSPTDAELKQYQGDWRQPYLTAIRDVAPLEWKTCHRDYFEHVPDPSTIEATARPRAVSVGLSSPMTTTEIETARIDDVIERFRSWTPTGEFQAPSRAGLGREFSSAVTRVPVRYAESALEFKDSRPVYVRSLISGLLNAAKEGRTFSWKPVLELCQWAVKQSESAGNSDNHPWDEDQGWGWTRQEIIRLLEQGFVASETEIPFELRPLVWTVLEPITSDADPTPESEAKFGGQNMSPADLSVNTTRGQAMHAVVRYGLWVRNQLEAIGRSSHSFEEMPEVRAILETHLLLEKDPSQAVRSVYGQRYPWIILLDRDWAESNVETVFPEESPVMRDAAWDAYVSFCPPYDTPFLVLKEQYAKAVDRLDQPRGEDRISGTPTSSLTEHIMTFYWQGKLPLEDQAGLLQTFYAKASPLLAAHALDFVGRTLANATDVPQVILDRMTALWSLRLKIAEDDTAQKHGEELASFGWWFACGKFEADWSLDQLGRVLKVSGKIDPAHKVVGVLSHLANDYPGMVTKILRLIVKGDTNGWGIVGWRDDLRVGIAAVLASGDEEGIEEATALVNELCARGYLEFKDLLPQITP